MDIERVLIPITDVTRKYLINIIKKEEVTLIQ